MNYVEKHISLEGEDLILNNLRAIFWPNENVLIASDLHIGKTAHFRKHGIPISSNVQNKDLERLSFLVDHYNTKKIIIVGDLFHAEENSDLGLFKDWRSKYSDLIIILIKGNHDRLKSEFYNKLNIIHYNDYLNVYPFKFIHEPKKVSNEFLISGHIHPGIIIKSKGRPRIKLPCFKVSNSQLILPAFSEFTGLAISENNETSICYAFTETSFFQF
ncbi:ligase-associated DNA damage response endonuclease PdeM [uncultured Psychroserpens sp.]|uniref:ligase-associated DNA damage response endonuclease PdeM n=1 Tax=uncultured Psychroserpens sp. TaxID=255436 RepID=UPI0026222B18|nr:ligase-associated DNA damage response endonuclease PdeM [uncultured Psychroserpens sp.]